MTVDPAVIPGLLLFLAELLALAAVGYIVARVALRQADARLALAQGLVIGPALWGLVVNFVLHLLPGLAGAAAAWGLTLALAVGLAWYRPATLRVPPRTLAGFAVAALALFWVVLASRQLLSIVDAYLHLGLAASIRAGSFPPAFPWQPGVSAPYHYGADLLTALLAPPVGPDLAFTTELIDAYAWMGLALIVLTTVRRVGGWVTVLVSCPLLLSFGLWTQLHYTPPPGIVQMPVLLGLPEAGLRTALANMYWPTLDYPWTTAVETTPANIWKPHFVLAYALACVGLERVTAGGTRSWLGQATLALLFAFLGLVDETVAPTVLGLWVVAEVLQLGRHAHLAPLFQRSRGGAAGRPVPWEPLLRAVAGPGLAALLLAVEGGAITGALTGSTRSGLSVGWIADAGSRRPVGAISGWPGGLGLLELGTVPVLAGAVLLAWRQRLVWALAAASGFLLLAALTLRYEYSLDLVRLDGHARNFALLALLVALAVRLAALAPRWRYAASALILALITWPTAVGPLHNLGLALTRGPQFANAQPVPTAIRSEILGRYVIRTPMSEVVTNYIRKHTALEARILSPNPTNLSIRTGRPNASGYRQVMQFSYEPGPEYWDAIRYLDPAAIRRLNFAYIHATEDWTAQLPDRAARWLNDPRLFERLIHHGGDSLYRVRPAFLALNAVPAPTSFEALRQAVPASAKVYISPSIEYLGSVRAASVLSHAQLFGVVRTFRIHLRPDFRIDPLGDMTPDFVVTSARLTPSALAPEARRAVWWNEEIAVYAPTGIIEPLMDSQPRHFSVGLSDVQQSHGRLTFTATFTDYATERWEGQDWLIFKADTSPWAFPYEFNPRGRIRDGRWFMGQLEPIHETLVHEYLYLYELEPRTGTLALWNGIGYASLSDPRPNLDPGVWVLAVRLNKVELNEAAFIPVLRFVLTETGEFSFEVYQGPLDAMLFP